MLYTEDIDNEMEAPPLVEVGFLEEIEGDGRYPLIDLGF